MSSLVAETGALPPALEILGRPGAHLDGARPSHVQAAPGTSPALLPRMARFHPPTFLAPMEGVTDACFRGMVLRHGGVGGACTEFLRITVSPVPMKVLRRHLGLPPLGPGSARARGPAEPEVGPAPSPGAPLAPPGTATVGVQLMAPDEAFVAESAWNAQRAGAAFVDLNFGCPAKIVFSKCAGSALLAKPEALERIVRAAAGAVSIPVTAKMRAGIEDPSRMTESLDAAARGGARLLTLHARLRRHSYDEPAVWPWLASAKAFLARAHPGLPLVGNGSVERPEDLSRMARETGVDGVMVGRGAIADPWIFARAAGRPPATREEALAFARTYARAIEAASGPRAGCMKLKQLLRYYTAGNLFADEAGPARRRACLHAGTIEEIEGLLGAP